MHEGKNKTGKRERGGGAEGRKEEEGGGRSGGPAPVSSL
jgi:hypothetical protein